jgi:hypothetical protein
MRLSIKAIQDLLDSKDAKEAKIWYTKLNDSCGYRKAERLINEFSLVSSCHGAEMLTQDEHEFQESLYSGSSDPYPYWYYANNGDSYQPTLIWSSKTGRFTIGSWGGLLKNSLIRSIRDVQRTVGGILYLRSRG